mmetsp:Transcript_67162/g.158337  ORF Transcript_67162/g.158337 Transcript_67162/m.158337 type:complete len:264 (-) Transcript_67162:104-895(-)
MQVGDLAQFLPVLLRRVTQALLQELHPCGKGRVVLLDLAFRVFRVLHEGLHVLQLEVGRLNCLGVTFCRVPHELFQVVQALLHRRMLLTMARTLGVQVLDRLVARGLHRLPSCRMHAQTPVQLRCLLFQLADFLDFFQQGRLDLLNVRMPSRLKDPELFPQGGDLLVQGGHVPLEVLHLLSLVVEGCIPVTHLTLQVGLCLQLFPLQAAHGRAMAQTLRLLLRLDRHDLGPQGVQVLDTVGGLLADEPKLCLEQVRLLEANNL